MFSKLFRIKCDVILDDESRGRIKTEAESLLDLTKDKHIKKIENEIKRRGFKQEGVIISKIENLEVKRIE